SGASRIIGIALTLVPMPVCVTRIDMMGLDEKRGKLSTAPFVSARRKRAQGVAMIALAPPDNMAPLGLANLDEILPRHLERGLDPFRPAADEIDVIKAFRRAGHEPVRQLLRGFGREETCVCVGEVIELPVQSGQHIGMAMAKARDRGAAGS